MLNVSTSSNGSFLTNWWGIDNLDFFIAHLTWEHLAGNIEDDYYYQRFVDGCNPQRSLV